jgi:hypothetical protein
MTRAAAEPWKKGEDLLVLFTDGVIDARARRASGSEKKRCSKLSEKIEPSIPTRFCGECSRCSASTRVERQATTI